MSETNCFALGDSDTIILAPYGSTVLPDGSGFVVGGREFRIGEPPTGMSVPLVDPDALPEALGSASLTNCRPKRIAVLFQEW